MTEPWLSGPVEGVDTLIAPIFYTFEQTRQELAQHTADFTTEQLWARPHEQTSAGFHIRHIGGSIDRLATYLRGEALSPEQLAALKQEGEPGASREELLAAVAHAMAACEAYLRTIDPATLRDARGIGRKQLPTTVNGLIVHIAEHTFRHLGQAITTIKLVRALG